MCPKINGGDGVDAVLADEAHQCRYRASDWGRRDVLAGEITVSG
jgi:hypothetical protein